jgi:hypothetical protein
MQPARSFGIANRFLHGNREGDYVVADFCFDFVDARDIHAGALAQGSRGLARHHAGFSERFAGGQLDFQPFLKAIFIAPDAAHFRASVACDQIQPPAAITNERNTPCCKLSDGLPPMAAEIPPAMIPESARASEAAGRLVWREISGFVSALWRKFARQTT